MSELKAYCPHANRDGFYHKSEADKVIAEKDAEIAELNQKLEDVNELIKTARQMLEDAKATLYTENERLKEGKNDYKQFYQDTFKELESLKASHYAESVDAGMRERRLRRALYKACANWAYAKMEYEQFDSNMFMCGFITDKEVSWESMMKKCLKKAEEYK